MAPHWGYRYPLFEATRSSHDQYALCMTGLDNLEGRLKKIFSEGELLVKEQQETSLPLTEVAWCDTARRLNPSHERVDRLRQYAKSNPAIYPIIDWLLSGLEWLTEGPESKMAEALNIFEGISGGYNPLIRKYYIWNFPDGKCIYTVEPERQLYRQSLIISPSWVVNGEALPILISLSGFKRSGERYARLNECLAGLEVSPLQKVFPEFLTD